MNSTILIPTAFSCDPTSWLGTPEVKWTRGNEAAPRGPEKTAQLEAKVQELETKVEELEAFSYSIAHDLRSPLRGIAGFTQILADDHDASLDDEGRRMLNIICDETQRMGRMIDDFLAFSRIGHQSPDAAHIDMTELARGAFQQLVAAGPAHLPSLEVKLLPPTRGDRSMVRQIFANLLGNAIKFTNGRPGSRIEVTGCTAGDWNTYCVADNGVGFDPRDQHKLFDVFQRLHSHRDFEGSGVGLALVRRIVQRHGGTAWAEGKINAGAKFYFTLPQSPENQTCHV